MSGPRSTASAVVEDVLRAQAAAGATLDALVAAATSALGAPTLTDPAHAAEQEVSWAVEHAADGQCVELRLSWVGDAPEIVHELAMRDDRAAYGACADAAAGDPRGRRFADAWRATEAAEPTEAAITASLTSTLGAPRCVRCRTDGSAWSGPPTTTAAAAR